MTDIIWHFFALNLIPKLSHHFSRESKSLYRATLSAPERMGRYKRQSSANSLTCEVTTDGRSLIWSKNKRGLSTVPCGTRDNTLYSFHNNPLNTVNKKGFNPTKDGAIYVIGAQFPQQASVWYSIKGRFWDIQRQRMAWPWNCKQWSFKVIENSAVR